MKYSLWCTLFGHVWKRYNRQYSPHYLKLVEIDAASAVLSGDYTIISRPSETCAHCGLTKKEVGITKNY